MVFCGLALLLYLGIRLGLGAPAVIKGPEIELAPRVLPYYAGLSLGRMVAAYILSILFSMVFGYLAARNRTAEKFLIPLLDVLQSVPILSFLPVALLSLSAILPIPWAVELSSIILIFTSQAWNIAFAWYQSLTTIPRNLPQASTIFTLTAWLRFKTLELPFAAISLIWNSMASWGGGWFFLMAAEIFSVGRSKLPAAGAGRLPPGSRQPGKLRVHRLGIGSSDPHHRHPGPVGVAASVGLVRTFHHVAGGKPHPSRPPGFTMP